MKTINIFRIIVCIAGIALGVYIFIGGLNYDIFGNDFLELGSTVSSTTEFGSDFYTYEYQATAQAANNVYKSIRVLRNGISAICCVAGAIMVIGFLMKLFDVLADMSKYKAIKSIAVPDVKQYAAISENQSIPSSY